MVQPSLDKYFTQLCIALIGVCSALTSFDGEVIFIVPYNVPSVTRELELHVLIRKTCLAASYDKPGLLRNYFNPDLLWGFPYRRIAMIERQ